MEYHKINSVFKRDQNTKFKTFLTDQYSEECFWYLKDNHWDFTEKVDGTNIRIIIPNTQAPTEQNLMIRIGGRTDNAQIPTSLFDLLQTQFVANPAPLTHIFPFGAVLFGEGYGGKIQKAGATYGSAQRFVMFDILVGTTWLSRKDVNEVGKTLGIDTVPVIGTGTLDDAIQKCKAGFKSRWGDFEAEGIVARPITELKDARGNRVITKIKCRDFK